MKKLLIAIIFISVITNAAIWHAIFIEKNRRELTVAILDVGQGDAIFIEAPNGRQIIVDGGPSPKLLAELGKVMPWYDKSIDMIVVTNPDKDHIAGFVDLLKRYEVTYVLEPGTENKTATNVALQDLIKEKGVEKILARRGLEIILEDHPEDEKDVRLTVLYPDRDVSKEKTNDGSIISRLIYGETEVILTGDAPMSVEKYLVSINSTTTPANLKLESDILKVGHHGSKTSSAEEFVRLVNPQLAVISSGRGNKYGHPDDEVLATLSKFSLKVLRTDELSTIIFKSDGKTFRIAN